MKNVLKLPEYREIPTYGFYVEQVVEYINEILLSVECEEITAFMVRNYVKNKLISNPEKKLYYPDQIAVLIFISIAKTVLSMEDIKKLLEEETKEKSIKEVYTIFKEEFEHVHCCEQQEVIHELVTAASKKLHLTNYLKTKY